jgi:hypothetical protein
MSSGYQRPTGGDFYVIIIVSPVLEPSFPLRPYRSGKDSIKIFGAVRRRTAGLILHHRESAPELATAKKEEAGLNFPHLQTHFASSSIHNQKP